MNRTAENNSPANHDEINASSGTLNAPLSPTIMPNSLFSAGPILPPTAYGGIPLSTFLPRIPPQPFVFTRPSAPPKTGDWSRSEDERLRSLINKEEKVDLARWELISSRMEGRSAEECRLRWSFYLRPGIRRGRWSNEEKKLFEEARAHLGNRWTAISQTIPGRTANSVQGYAHRMMRKNEIAKAVSEAGVLSRGRDSVEIGDGDENHGALRRPWNHYARTSEFMGASSSGNDAEQNVSVSPMTPQEYTGLVPTGQSHAPPRASQERSINIPRHSKFAGIQKSRVYVNRSRIRENLTGGFVLETQPSVTIDRHPYMAAPRRPNNNFRVERATSGQKGKDECIELNEILHQNGKPY